MSSASGGKLIAVIGLAAALPLALVLGVAVGAAGSDSASTTAICGLDAGQENLSAEQAASAQSIVQVAVEMKLPFRAAVIAIATAMQESSLISRTGGDRDSLGLFQQRPSQGWGSPAQLTTPAYAARAFYTHLIAIPGWQTLPLTQAAQPSNAQPTPAPTPAGSRSPPASSPPSPASPHARTASPRPPAKAPRSSPGPANGSAPATSSAAAPTPAPPSASTPTAPANPASTAADSPCTPSTTPPADR